MLGQIVVEILVRFNDERLDGGEKKSAMLLRFLEDGIGSDIGAIESDSDLSRSYFGRSQY